jgi:hypothetical protein
MSSIEFFTDYHPRGSNFSDPGYGNPYIDFQLEIPVSDKKYLLEHIITCGKTNRFLSGINYSENQRDLVLPIIEGEEFKNHLKKISSFGFSEENKNEFRNMKNRLILLARTPTHIVGIQPIYGKVLLTVNEVNAIKSCMKSYVLTEDRVKDYKHHIPIERWKESAYEQFMDPISLELLVDPVIASDGHTYSQQSLIKIFKNDRLSPLTRELLEPIGKISFWETQYTFEYEPNKYKELGIRNIMVEKLLQQFIDGKLKSSNQKYLKYKSKYITLKNIIN